MEDPDFELSASGVATGKPDDAPTSAGAGERKPGGETGPKTRMRSRQVSSRAKYRDSTD